MPERKNIEKLYYTENQTIPNQLEYPILGAAGGNSRSKEKTSYYRPGDRSLEELINATSSQGNMGSEFGGADENGRIQIDPDQQNAILGIPSFLVYPQELGKNRRFRHFITLNIYQGTSDEVRLSTREYNQVTSSILAKGGNQFAGEARQGWLIGDNETETYNTLIRAGYSQAQADRYSKAIFSSEGLRSSGLTSDENIGALEGLLQGAGDAGVIESTYNAAKDAFVNSVDFFASYGQASIRDNLAEANKNPRNYNRRGASGRAVNRPREEQNILLANRRFNNANVKSKDTICLYMPQKFSVNDQLIYSEEEMGTSKMVLDALTGKRGAVSAALEKVARKGIADTIGSIGQFASTVPAVGTAINEGLQEVNAGAIRAAQQRTVQNPRREMMFRDVGTRSHNFTFDFAPRNEKEAETVLNIIRMLRYHAYPGLQGGGGHFFTFPAEFEMSFFTIEEPSGMIVINDNLPKLPRLALQSINVDYAAAGDFKTFTDSKPAFIRLELGFQEMEQLTNEHIVHGY
jgi:hypothetical protein